MSKTTESIEKAVNILKVIKYCCQYDRLEKSISKEVLDEAWQRLDKSSQDKIIAMIENNIQPTPKAIAEEMLMCQSKEELTLLKAEFGAELSKEAWMLLSNDEKVQIQQMCALPVKATSETSGVEPTPESESQADETEEDIEPEPEPEVEMTAPKSPSSQRELSVELDLGISPKPVAEAAEPKSVKPKSLIELSAEEEELQEIISSILEDTDGRIPPELAIAFDELLSRQVENEKQLKVKIDNYCAVMKHHYDWVEIRRKESERLKELADKDLALAKVLEARLKNYLETSGQMKVKTKRFNPRICKNGGKQPLFLDIKAEDLPKEYKVTKELISADSDALRKALEEGKELPFAHLGERGNHLRFM